MSPGATFERVYTELRRMLTEGELPPGGPIEPAAIGRQIASSITPVRDALHRLTGERLVEAPNHNGFRVPLPTEAALRDLYGWNGLLVGLAVRRTRSPSPGLVMSGAPAERDVATATADLFLEIAAGTGSAEHVRAIQQLSHRLAPFRRLEGGVLDGVAEEYTALAFHHQNRSQKRLPRLLERYHSRRLRVVPALLVRFATAESGLV